MRLVSNLPRAVGAAAALAALALGAQAQTLGCSTGGAGGAVPAAGTGGAGAPLPATPFVSVFNVASIPVGATSVTEVKLLGLTHTFTGDVQWVLTDPSGGQHNLFSRLCGGSDFGGDYTIVPQCTGGIDTITCTAVLPTAVYGQNFGAFVSGTGGVNNTPLSGIAAATGNWTLTGYDWAGGDVGVLTSWDICFGTPPAPAAPATAPALATPANAAVATNPVTLTWGAVACATGYDVDLDGVITSNATTSFAAPVLAPGVHTWTVRAKNVTGTTAYAASRTFTVPTPPPASTCVANGLGSGLVPATGTGGTGAVWPGTFPATPYANTYNVTLPGGATKIVKVDITFSTEHTWAGDLQFVLTDPTGGRHNIVNRVGSVANSVGLNCDLNGAYSIYESSGQGWPTVCPASTDIPAGDYVQNIGDWVSGTNGVFNTPLSLIPIANGNWTLTAYDWVGGDSGAISDWKLCFDSGPVAPPTYCTAGTTTNGCLAAISANVNPNVANTAGCVISVANVEGQKQGLVFYGINQTGFTPNSWGVGSNSFLCVKAPTQRMGGQSSGGAVNACDGAFSYNWDAFVAANPTAVGVPFAAGAKVYAQAWFRDPAAAKTTNLSNALEMTVAP